MTNALLSFAVRSTPPPRPLQCDLFCKSDFSRPPSILSCACLLDTPCISHASILPAGCAPPPCHPAQRRALAERQSARLARALGVLLEGATASESVRAACRQTGASALLLGLRSILLSARRAAPPLAAIGLTQMCALASCISEGIVCDV